MKKIDEKQLVTVTGGVRPGPNGEGCTQQGGPLRPRPRPPVLRGMQNNAE